MKHTALLTTLVISIAAGATLASGSERGAGGPGPHFNFEEVDTNKDGKLTEAEMAAHMDARFAETDANGDGLVSEAELRSHMQKMANQKIDRRIGHMMDRHDANGDGQLDKDEMKPNRMGRMMKHMDQDGDGAISKSEFEAMKNMRGKRHKHKDEG